MRYTFAGKEPVIFSEGKAGFIDESVRELNEYCSIPELTDAFHETFWLDKEHVTKISSDESGAYVSQSAQGTMPLSFMATVSTEGNYLIKTEITAVEDTEDVLIFTSRRRLVWRGKLKAGEKLDKQFMTNVCPIIPRDHKEAWEDKTVNISVVGKSVRLSSVDIYPWNGKTIYLAGDSTVTDQNADYPYLPKGSYCAWGQMLQAFVGSEAVVSNHAHSGLTTETFRNEGHYQILIDRIKKDDICMIQFGHNDQKLEHLSAKGGYRENLITYVNELRAKGAIPVIVSSLARNTWNEDGTYNDLLKAYDEECKLLCKEMDVPFIGLHDYSMEKIKSVGKEEAKNFCFPGDWTHSNDYGAYMWARFIAKELDSLGLVKTKDIGEWEPAEKANMLDIPKEYQHVDKPEGYGIPADVLGLIKSCIN